MSLRERRARVAAAAMLAAALSLAVVTFVLAPSTAHSRGADDVAWSLGSVAFAFVGAVVVRSRPEHRIGWVFLWAGLLNAATDAAYAYGGMAVEHPLPFGAVVAWLATWTWAPTIGLFVLAIATFPTGRPLNRWLGGVAWLGVGLAVTVAAVNAVVFWSLRDPSLTLPGAETTFDNLGTRTVATLFPLVMLTAIISLVGMFVRFHRATGVERQQLKWLAVAAFVMGPALVLGGALDLDGVTGQILGVLGAPMWVAVTAGVAVLRYRLYDVDRIVSRTLSYVLLTAILLLVYASSVLGLGSVARALAGESGDLVVALSTLLVAAAFQPVRRRVQSAVDRRFNRGRVDGLRAAEDFGRRLRGEVELEAVVEDLRRTVRRTLQPASASVVTVGSVDGRTA